MTSEYVNFVCDPPRHAYGLNVPVLYRIPKVHLTIAQMVEDAIQKRVGGSDKAVEDMTLDELDEIEDEADEKILLEYRYRWNKFTMMRGIYHFLFHCSVIRSVSNVESVSLSVYVLYRQKRMAEIMAAQKKSLFGSVREISAIDYVDEVNKAGEGVWVILHLYKSGYPHSCQQFPWQPTYQMVAMATQLYLISHTFGSRVWISKCVYSSSCL